ncbi:MAG: hypothetical protein EZS28_004102 [Streblomastix strix]|uniref:Uncharacterized protein n=1 Tax=Streblomastix strix TaxID=222440 RepID=A0A5J4WZ18_9EUKA|nr:MAG: hypothetical protein EZS28_004102 [Streblomastix strix]
MAYNILSVVDGGQSRLVIVVKLSTEILRIFRAQYQILLLSLRLIFDFVPRFFGSMSISLRKHSFITVSQGLCTSRVIFAGLK